MADYYSVITRAVSNLPSQTVEARWAIYDDACVALQKQLLALDPPISEDELANEQLALEAAIRKVEEDLLLGTMRRFVREDAPYAAPSLSIISTVREFVRAGGDELNDAITVVRDRLRSSGATELVPTKAEITARLAQSLAFVQRTQLQTKNLGWRIYSSIFGDKSC
jgi:hypothetical protein